LGDLESHEIGEVVSALVGKERNRFSVVLTPHHGTHWHDGLRQIRATHAISSVGRGLFRYIRPEFKEISDLSLVTHVNGDVEVPLCSAWWNGPRYWRFKGTFL